jgi:hypothetical protein
MLQLLTSFKNLKKMTMKIMLKQLPISAMLVCMFSLAKAQDGPAPTEKQIPTAEKRSSKMTEWMKTNLNLSADQLTQVQGLNMKYAVKMDSLRNSDQARQDKFAAMKSDDAARDSELKGILTDEQYKTYQEKKQEMRGRYKEKLKDKSL